jgi:hypothetical protein
MSGPSMRCLPTSCPVGRSFGTVRQGRTFRRAVSAVYNTGTDCPVRWGLLEKRVDKSVLRDFVYLDLERVRSYVAQLLEGVPESTSAGRSHQTTATGNAEASLFSLLKTQGGVDYRFLTNQNETRSLHHYIYQLCEQELDRRGLVTRIDKKFDHKNWSEGFFRDGQFVLASGPLRLMDYDFVMTTMKNAPEMMRTINHMQNFSSIQHGVDERILHMQKFDQAKDIEGIEGFKPERFAAFVEQMYGNVVRVKVLPNRNHPTNLLIGSGNPQYFQDKPATLNQRYGYEIDTDWLVLGQINIARVSDVASPLPTGNAMDDAIEQMALIANNLIRIASGVKFPAVSFTPLAIYRQSEARSRRHHG